MLKKDSHNWILVFLCIAFVVAAPWIFTRYSGITSFENTGQIGDTIGGITAPIIGCISAILVYAAFRAQIKANELIQIQIHREDMRKELDRIEDYCDELSDFLGERISVQGRPYKSDFNYLRTHDVQKAAYMCYLYSELLNRAIKMGAKDPLAKRISEIGPFRLHYLMKVAQDRLSSEVTQKDKDYFSSCIDLIKR